MSEEEAEEGDDQREANFFKKIEKIRVLRTGKEKQKRDVWAKKKKRRWQESETCASYVIQSTKTMMALVAAPVCNKRRAFGRQEIAEFVAGKTGRKQRWQATLTAGRTATWSETQRFTHPISSSKDLGCHCPLWIRLPRCLHSPHCHVMSWKLASYGGLCDAFHLWSDSQTVGRGIWIVHPAHRDFFCHFKEH